MEFVNFAIAMIIVVVAWRAVVLLLSRPARSTSTLTLPEPTALTVAAPVASTPAPRRSPHRVRVASRRPSLRVRSTS